MKLFFSSLILVVLTGGIFAQEKPETKWQIYGGASFRKNFLRYDVEGKTIYYSPFYLNPIRFGFKTDFLSGLALVKNWRGKVESGAEIELIQSLKWSGENIPLTQQPADIYINQLYLKFMVADAEITVGAFLSRYAEMLPSPYTDPAPGWFGYHWYALPTYHSGLAIASPEFFGTRVVGEIRVDQDGENRDYMLMLEHQQSDGGLKNNRPFEAGLKSFLVLSKKELIAYLALTNWGLEISGLAFGYKAEPREKYAWSYQARLAWLIAPKNPNYKGWAAEISPFVGFEPYVQLESNPQWGERAYFRYGLNLLPATDVRLGASYQNNPFFTGWIISGKFWF